MITDRYLKVVLTVIAVALAAIAARPWLPATRVDGILGSRPGQRSGGDTEVRTDPPEVLG
jgi:hypothetical protein